MSAQTSATRDTEEQTVLAVEGAFAAPLGDPERNRFGFGGSLAVSGYRSVHPVLSLGLRLRGTLLADGATPTDARLEDEGVGGLYSLSAALRLRPFGEGHDRARFTGPYVEVAAGGALTEDIVRPALSAAVGYDFAAGDIGIGPVARYQWVPHEGELQDDDGHFLFLGVEVVFFDGRGYLEPEPAPVAATREPEPEPVDPCPGEEDVDGFQDDDECPDPDNDQDGILDVVDHCPNLPETINGYNDHDGCPDQAQLVMVDDRIVISDDVFFDFDESHLRARGLAVIRQLVALWGEHPEWTGMLVEGHTDARGSNQYNIDLAARRARAVRDALVAEGLEPERIRMRAEGEREPAVPGADSEREHQLNRRVEFVVDRTQPAVETSDHPNAPANQGDEGANQ